MRPTAQALTIAVLTLTFALTAQARKSTIPKAKPCKAIEFTDWPSPSGAVITLCAGQMTVFHNGKVAYRSASLTNTDGWAEVDSLGKPQYQRKNGRVVIPFKATEGAAEYEGNAKGLLSFDGKRWYAECGTKSCEVLPIPGKHAKQTGITKTPRSYACNAMLVPTTKGSSDGLSFVGCKKSGAFFVFARARTMYDLNNLEVAGTVEFQGMKSLVERNRAIYLPMTFKETTEPVGAGTEEPEEPQTGKAKAHLLFVDKGLSLVCAQKRCLLLPKK